MKFVAAFLATIAVVNATGGLRHKAHKKDVKGLDELLGDLEHEQEVNKASAESTHEKIVASETGYLAAAKDLNDVSFL